MKPRGASWDAVGPDLLRTWDNARDEINRLLPERPRYYEKRDDVWKPIETKVGEFLVSWKQSKRSELVLGAKRFGIIRPVVFVRKERIRFIDLPNCSPDTSWVHSLVMHQWADKGVEFSGGYVWKPIGDTSLASDHAWGTAVDETARELNDKLTDWVARMGRTGNMSYDYALGSKDGQVVNVEKPDYQLIPSSASNSHLWHVHISVVDHNGQWPPRQGGVW